MFQPHDGGGDRGSDGQMDSGVQFILGLFLLSAFVGLVFLVAGGA